MSNFKDELTKLINKYSEENTSNTPDFILVEYIITRLENFNTTVNKRSKWYGRFDSPGQSNT